MQLQPRRFEHLPVGNLQQGRYRHQLARIKPVQRRISTGGSSVSIPRPERSQISVRVALYSEMPERFEYLLTQRGGDLQPVLAALKSFGERHYPKRRARV